jgi:hypothetical protein
LSRVIAVTMASGDLALTAGLDPPGDQVAADDRTERTIGPSGGGRFAERLEPVIVTDRVTVARW